MNAKLSAVGEDSKAADYEDPTLMIMVGGTEEMRRMRLLY